MLGILVALALSWLLLYLFEKRSLLALGVFPIPARLKEFLIGCAVTAVLCVLAQLLESTLKGSSWVMNEHITGTIVAASFWWDFKSVLTEELIFRGALLYILIQKIGSRKSVLISAVTFGVYHWFSYGVLGDFISMILVFIGTGLMGYAWARAFSKTQSIMLPLGRHLGWNFTYNTLFSKGPLGALVFILQGGTELTGWTSLLNFVTGLIIVPVLVLIYVRYFVPDRTL